MFLYFTAQHDEYTYETRNKRGNIWTQSYQATSKQFRHYVVLIKRSFVAYAAYVHATYQGRDVGLKSFEVRSCIWVPLSVISKG